MKKSILFLTATLTFNFQLLTFNCTAQYTKLLDFAGTLNGSYPVGSLVSDGIFLYGMTFGGGINNDGVIFKIKPDGTGYSKLLDFAGTTNGSSPKVGGALIFDGTFLYGTATYGGIGTCNGGGCGVVFKIKPDGTGYSKLHDFLGSTSGQEPFGPLISVGTFLYGMTIHGGTGTCPDGCGVLFKIKPDGTGYSKLLDFLDTTNGSNPCGSLISDGTFLYGMTSSGGINSAGTIFKINPDGTGYFKLLEFASIANGADPMGSLISDGTFLYGMTRGGGISDMGVIFKIKPDGTGYSKLLDFNGTNGKNPYGSLISDGTFLYGMTSQGGTTDSVGTIFKIKPDGTGYAKLIDFSGASSGSYPDGSLISVGASLYGTTGYGGTSDMGTIFKYAFPTGIVEHNKAIILNISPNPFNSQTTITFSEEQKNTTIKIMDVLGKEIKSINFTAKQLTIEKGEMQAGIYFVRLIDENKNVVNKKIVVQ